MKKILTKCLSLVAMLACIVTLASCVAVSSNTSIQINKFPEETYVVNSSREQALEAISIAIFENGVEIKNDTLKALDSEVSIQGFSLEKTGTFTAKITYKTATVSFTYTVVADSANIQSEDDLINVLKSAEETIAITLTSNIELANQIVIPANKTVILDLNGCTIKTKQSYGTDYLINVTEGATLEVKDSSEDADGKILNEKVDVNGLFNVSGELVVRNGNYIDYSQTFNKNDKGEYAPFVNDYNENQGYYGAVLMLNPNGILTIYNGVFESKKPENHVDEAGKALPYGKPLLYLHANSLTKIYDGEFSNDAEDSPVIGAYMIQSVGQLYIYNGQFVGGRGPLALVGGQFDVRGGYFLAKKWHGVYITGKYDTLSGVISGGTFEAEGANGHAICFNDKADHFVEMDSSTLVITGGTYYSHHKKAVSYTTSGIGHLLVQGGLYKGAVDAHSLAQGYVLGEVNSQGYKEVVKE